MHPNISALTAGVRAIMAARTNDGDVLLEWAHDELVGALEGDHSLDRIHEGLQPVFVRVLSEAGARLSADSLSKIAVAIEALSSLLGREPEGNDVEDAYKALQDAVAEPVAEGSAASTPPSAQTLAESAPPPPEPDAQPGTIPTGAMRVREAVSILGESAGGAGSVFRTLVIETGRSKNGVEYPRDVLKRAAPLLEGRPIYIDHPAPGSNERSMRDKVGWWEGVSYEPVTRPDGSLAEGLVANLHLYRNSGQPWFREMVAEAVERGRPQDIGISILAAGSGNMKRDQGGIYKEVTEISVFASADAVAEPGAGGRPLSLVASDGKDKDVMNLEGMTLQEIWRQYPELTNTQIRELRSDLFDNDGVPLREATAPVATETPPAPPAAITPPPAAPPAEPLVSREAFDAMATSLQAIQIAQTQTTLENIMRESGLPASIWPRIRERVGQVIQTEAQLRETVNEYVEILGAAAPAGAEGRPTMAGMIVPYGQVTGGLSMEERVQYSLDRFFGAPLPAEVDESSVPTIRSFREFYVGVTGDQNVEGRYRPEFSWFREALPGATHVVGGTTVTMPNLIGTSMNRSLMAAYRGQRRWWEPVVSKVSFSDFKEQQRVRLNNFGSLTERVVDGIEYIELDWGDSKEVYTPTEFGNVVSVGRRAIINDDMRGIQQIPRLLAVSAAITLNEYVSALFTVNSGNGPTLSDGFNVFNAANHQGNRVTTAFSRQAVIDLMKVMMKFTNNAGKRIGVEPRFLLMPVDMFDSGYELANTQQVPDSANNALNVLASDQFGIRQPIVVPQWTDTNNWYLMADPAQVPGIEVGFLFGRDTPELMAQTDPLTGMVFTNDVITYKVRFDFGGGWTDWRAAAASIVA